MEYPTTGYKHSKSIKPAKPHTKPTHMTKPETGDKASDFTLVNQEMKPTSLRDHRGHKVVLAFYPGAYTGVCKKELCTIRDNIARLEELDAHILAISVNDPFTNKAFHDENDLNFPLLCDYNREAVKKYNVVHENFWTQRLHRGEAQRLHSGQGGRHHIQVGL
jgi:peroxiredoxin